MTHPNAPTFEQARVVFPFLDEISTQSQREFIHVAQLVTLPPAQLISLEGEACTQFALVLSGAARVYKMAQTGREITLYRLESGESCIITASCILGEQTFPALAITETEMTVVAVPSTDLRRWMIRDSVWQQYVFGLLSQRFVAVMELLESVAFERLDQRIAAYLRQRATIAENVLQTTHELIAQELGSSREVVSRILKDFERRGMVRLARGTITLVNPELLARVER